MASSSNDPDSLVTLHFHDFRVERMRHWWTLLGEDDHADIVGIFGKFSPFMRLQVDRGLLEALASFWDPTHCCFSIGEVDLVPHLGGFYVLRSPDLRKLGGKANISLDLLTKYFSRSDFPVKLARDFIAGKKGWKKFRINAFKIAFAGIFLFPTSAGRIDLGVIPPGRGGSDVLHTAPPALVLQSPAAFLPPPDLLITLRGIRSLGGQQCGGPWTHCALFDGVPLPGVWGCTGYYPSLALRQFGGVQYPPRLGDLDASSSRRVRPGDSSVASDFVEWREGWTPFFTLRPTVRPGASYSLVSRSLRVSASTGQPERVTVLERELEKAQTELLSLRLARASEREESAARVESLRSTLHHNSVAVANLRRDLEAQRGNVSTLRTMNEFIREQLEISEDAKDQLEETLAETREQLETEQAERTRVQDELDSLRSYTQALVDPATGRPQDIVALRRALDASEEALTSARTSMGAMRVQISVLQGGFPRGHSSSSDQSGDGFFGCQELAPSWRSMMRGIRPFPLPWGDSAERPAYVLVIR
uniref:Aminotransferase-like plant mobile domain-containing protein n=1 Tax=Fagus sylvatica TaxID=28930 RepID=A0A2N9F419_FAGSY